MTATPDDWAVAVKAGDTLSISTTYDTSRASWYESMGLGVVWMYDGPGGNDPFTEPDRPARRAHPRSPARERQPRREEDEAHRSAPGGRRVRSPATIPIGSFEYGAGDLTVAGGRIPTVTEGKSITFDNLDAGDQQVWHSITACKAPCTASTGIAYPLADATVQFDSGQLGTGGRAHLRQHDLEHAGRPHPPGRTPTSAAFTRSCAARSACCHPRLRHPSSSRSRADRPAPRPGCPRR